MAVQNTRPSYVSFETRLVEKQHLRPPEGTGLAYAVEVDFALITPQGTKDVILREVQPWLDYLQMQVDQEMMPIEVLNRYKAQYEAYKTKQEIPVEGTPIKGWPLATLAQQDACLRANIRTVEDLANCSSEAIGRIGMGAQELRNRAGRFLEAQNGTAPMVARLSSLETTVNAILAENRKLQEENKILKSGGVSVFPKQEISPELRQSPDVSLGVDDTPRGDNNLVDKILDNDPELLSLQNA